MRPSSVLRIMLYGVLCAGTFGAAAIGQETSIRDNAARRPLLRSAIPRINPRTGRPIVPSAETVYTLALDNWRRPVSAIIDELRLKNNWTAEQAITRLASQWKGYAAEAAQVNRFNAAATRRGLAIRALLEPDRIDPRVDLRIVNGNGGVVARYQSKYGSLDYVWKEVGQQKYNGIKILVSPENLAAIREKVIRKPMDPYCLRVQQRLQAGEITDQIAEGGVITRPLPEQQAYRTGVGKLRQYYDEQKSIPTRRNMPVRGRTASAAAFPAAVPRAVRGLRLPVPVKLACVTAALSGVGNGARVYRGEITLREGAINTTADVTLSQGGYWVGRGVLTVLEEGGVRLALPAAAGILGGVSTVVFDAGRAGLSFACGEIGRDGLLYELGGATFKGAAVGTATAVTVVLVSGPAGWTVVVVGVGCYLVADLVSEQFRSTAPLTLRELAALLPPETLARPTMLETLRGSDPRFANDVLDRLLTSD